MDGRPVALVVDDRPNMLKLMAKVLGPTMAVRTANSGVDAIAALRREHIDVVLCDLKMPDMSGLDVLRACKEWRPGAAFVLMTAYATVPTAVEALRLGAYDYVTKPFEPDHVRAVLHCAAGLTAEPLENAEREVLPGVLAVSPAMAELASMVRRLAASHVTALVLGETGTGKERVARALHLLGPRAGRRFVAVNCSAIPADLLESELFGYARGAFTGAARERAGLFEEAARGTLFLDEVGDMPLALQAKLTRVLEERAVRRLGESTERPVDVRVVAATHRDLGAMVEDGNFREDLWYRMNVATLRLPALRDRSEDIELLALHFLEEHKRRSGKLDLHGFSQGALDALREYDWPGNIRQLRSAVDRACVVASGDRIRRADLPPELAALEAYPAARSLRDLTWAEALEAGRDDVARRYLTAILRAHRGHVTEAAEQAGVERESFYRLCRKYGVHPAAYRRSR